MVSEENGIDFILTHLEEPLFPRTISTYRSEGRQFEVFSKEEMIKAFEQSDFLDCRVNAYPSYTEYKGINRQAPNFLFIDLDKDIVGTARAHRLALTNTLRNIKEKLSEAYPTVLWSGNGYHIYQPIEAFVLEEEEVFSSNEFDQPSKAFLKFAEQYLSNNKSDPSHNPSFKSCMIRIPGSFNSKCILKGKDSEVKIIQRWDGYRPKINLLLRSFHAYLVDQRIKELQRQKEQIKKYRQKHGDDVNDIKWIEILLETPISDYRKNAINLILAPYLINIKKLPYTDAFNIIKDWLNKCDSLRRLDSNFNYRLKSALEDAIQKGIPSMSLAKLREKNKELYDLLSVRMNNADYQQREK
ncbi:MAG: DNA primase noncatalytic subunit PriX [Thermoproteota archaeon]|nr:DNA primase noncatalytic subunit PriX [Thermoproteota archaeon]